MSTHVSLSAEQLDALVSWAITSGAITKIIVDSTYIDEPSIDSYEKAQKYHEAFKTLWDSVPENLQGIMVAHSEELVDTIEDAENLIRQFAEEIERYLSIGWDYYE